MMSIPLGPLALPVAPLLLPLCTWLAAWVADRVIASTTPLPAVASRTAGSVLVRAALMGLFVARLAHVALHMAAYGSDPWSIVDVRDGGWHGGAGLATGIVWVTWQALRHGPWRKALAAGAAAGLTQVPLDSSQVRNADGLFATAASLRLELQR